MPLPSRGRQLFRLHPCVSAASQLCCRRLPASVVCYRFSHFNSSLLFPRSRSSTLYKRPVKATDEEVSSPRLPLDATDRSQNVWQWILESERQGKHKPHRYGWRPRHPHHRVSPHCVPSPSHTSTRLCPNSTQGLKKSNPLDAKTLPSRTHSSWGGGGIGSGAHLRGHHPGHPFIQDPAMPPLPPPNTLAQLEEACRRLEEVSKPPKQR